MSLPDLQDVGIMTIANCDLCHKKAEFIARLQPFPDSCRRYLGSYFSCYGHDKLRDFLDQELTDLIKAGYDVPPFFAEA